MTQTQKLPAIVCAYTQHEMSIRAIEEMCNVSVIRLTQDRTKDTVEDILMQVPIPYTVLPYDERHFEKLRGKARVWLMELGNKILMVANIPPESESYEYTALPREVATFVEEKAPWVKMKTLELADKPIAVIEGHVPIVLYAVLPIDKAVELKQKVPWLKLRLLQLDGSVVERLTGKPYDPKSEYPLDVIKAALKVVAVKGGTIRYMTFLDMISEIARKGATKIGVFNDAMREGFKLATLKSSLNIELVKKCDDSCVEINPLGFKSGYRVSFPGTAGKLTPEQMAEMILSGMARIYYAEVIADETSLCP